MVTVCPSQFATRRTLFHVLVGCGLLMLKVSRLKLPVIWLLVRSEERFSRNAETDLVCRLLLEKKKKTKNKYKSNIPNPDNQRTIYDKFQMRRLTQSITQTLCRAHATPRSSNGSATE